MAKNDEIKRLGCSETAFWDNGVGPRFAGMEDCREFPRPQRGRRPLVEGNADCSNALPDGWQADPQKLGRESLRVLTMDD